MANKAGFSRQPTLSRSLLVDRTTEYSKFTYSEQAFDLNSIAELSVGQVEPLFELSPREE